MAASFVWLKDTLHKENYPYVIHLTIVDVSSLFCLVVYDQDYSAKDQNSLTLTHKH